MSIENLMKKLVEKMSEDIENDDNISISQKEEFKKLIDECKNDYKVNEDFRIFLEGEIKKDIAEKRETIDKFSEELFTYVTNILHTKIETASLQICILAELLILLEEFKKDFLNTMRLRFTKNDK